MNSKTNPTRFPRYEYKIMEKKLAHIDFIKKWCEDHKLEYVDLDDCSNNVIRVIYDLLTANIMTGYHIGLNWDHTKDPVFRRYQIYNYAVRGNHSKASKIYAKIYDGDYKAKFGHLIQA